MAKITDLKAREVLDSRGNPTVQVDCEIDKVFIGRATIPSGASTGKREALELRDNDSTRYHGKGVQKAIENIHKVIRPELIGEDPFNQSKIDQMLIDLDGTPNKSRLGANAILGVSLSVAKASALYMGVELYDYLGGINASTLPVPLMNIINGGVHADNPLSIQEFMIVPTGFTSFKDALRAGAEIFQTLKRILKDKGEYTGVGDEGGFAPQLNKTEDALNLIIMAIEKAGYRPGEQVHLALDVAASELYSDNKYKIDGNLFDSDALIKFYIDLIERYPLISIEDPCSEDDWDLWVEVTKELGKKTQVVGDDVFVTNPILISKGISEGVGNAVLIKLNQIGTLSETLEAIKLAKSSGYKVVISHRSGETEDTTISDLSVGTNAGQIKTGALSRSERTAKYNRLLLIEEQLGISAYYPGIKVYKTQ